MKKFLSLALALVMTMSLVTISAGATFTDDASITYEEAVDVMYALDIIGGYTDGSFDPTATLTRGAAAKIICNMLLGPTTADALGADSAPFPDVAANHVFAGYIAYCASQGILSGYADGNFYPAGEVTGVQFMKMLLGALGYDSAVEGFTGDNWSVNVQKLALSLGLDDGNDSYTGSAAMTREEACLYALNTLEATLVEYDSTTNITVGDINITSSSSYEKVTSTNKIDYNGADDDYRQFCEEYFDDLEKTEGDTDAFGRPAVSWEYDGDDIGTYVDVDDLEDSFEGLVTKDDIYDSIGKTVFEDIEDEDAYMTVYVDGQEVADYIIGSDVENYAKSGSSSYIARRGAVTDVFVDDDNNVTIVIVNTYLVQATDDYDADDEVLEIEEIDDIDYEDESGNYTMSDSYKFDGVTFDDEIDNDDVNVEEFLEDDYILITVADGEIQTAVLADVITGSVSTYAADSSVTVDGTKYNYSYAAASSGTAQNFVVGEDAVVALDAQGFVIYVDDASVSSDRYVFIDALDESSNFSSYTYYAAAYFSDGTYAEIELEDIFGDDADNTLDYDDGSEEGYDQVEKKWFTYTTNSDGSYDLTEVEDDYSTSADDGNNIGNQTNSYFNGSTTGSTAVISSGSVTFTKYGMENVSSAGVASGDTVSIKGDSNTVFVIVDEDDDVYTYTGVSNVADVYTNSGETASVYALIEDDGYAAFVFVDASNATVDGASEDATDYMFVLENGTKTVDSSDDTVYMSTEVLIEGEIVTITFTDDAYGDMSEGALYYDITMDGDGYIDSGKSFVKHATEGYDDNSDEYYYASQDTTVTYSGDVISFTSIDDMDFIVDDDSEIYIIVAEGVDALLDDDSADYEVSTYSSAKSVYNFFKGYTVEADIYMVADDDGTETITALYIFVTDADET